MPRSRENTQTLTAIDEVISKLMGREPLPPEVEEAYLREVALAHPERLPELTLRYVEKCQNLDKGLQAARKTVGEMKGFIEKLTDTPWYPAIVSRECGNSQTKVVVSVGPTEVLVGCNEGIDPATLQVGQQVFLAQEKNCIVGVDDLPRDFGETGLIEHLLGDDKALLKVREGDELVVRLAGALREQPPPKKAKVTFSRQHLMAFKSVPEDKEKESLLEEVDSDVTLDMVGGLNQVIEEICDEIYMQLFHHDTMEAHGLRPARGILLVSPPGNGKTMIAKALSNFVRGLRPSGEVRFLSLAPGAHRSPLYGASDRSIINTFKVAREFARVAGNICVIFMDELDNWGRRSADIGNTIDSRVMDTLLTQIDGIDSSDHILLIGASNRADDMLDVALTRPGRFGDNVFRLPRPGREAAADIFSRYLSPSLPYRRNGQMLDGTEASARFVDAAVARIFSPNGGSHKVAELVMRDGTRREVLGPELISGAIIENMARKAKQKSCLRALNSRPGIMLEELIEAVDSELSSSAKTLRSPCNARDILGLSADLDFRVVLPSDADNASSRDYQWVRS
jgi:proteasome-associated ATPase